MRIGVVFPQTEIGHAVADAARYATTVERLGYVHLIAFDHVVGADPAVHEGWDGWYDVDSTFHEPFVLFGYLAAITKLELAPSIIILPQRQTALVAKQAAEVALLSGNRLRLGVGTGWNHVEYTALGQSFADRGARLTELGREVVTRYRALQASAEAAAEEHLAALAALMQAPGEAQDGLDDGG